MPLSQNLRFVAHVPPADEFDHPRGGALAILLQSALLERGWKASAPENWRDSGWALQCERDAAQLDVTFAHTEVESEWFLQVLPSYLPGCWGRVVGRSASASAHDVLRLSRDVHAILSQHQVASDFKWRWDGPPDDSGASAEPGDPGQAMC